MKKIFFSLLFTVTVFSSYGQNEAGKEYVFSAGAEGGVTVGPYSNRHNFMYGGSVQADYYFYESAAVTFKVAYELFPTKPSIYYDSSSGRRIEYGFPAHSFVPVLLGLKAIISERYYMHPQVGVAFRSFGPMGASFALGMGRQSKHFDLSFRMEGFKKGDFTVAVFALRAAYQF